MTEPYVRCEATITSPAPPEGFKAATGLQANETCGAKCKVNAPDASVLHIICPMGHEFITSRSAIIWE